MELGLETLNTKRLKRAAFFPRRGERSVHISCANVSFLSVAEEEEEEEKLSLYLLLLLFYTHHLVSVYRITKGKRSREIFIHSFSGKDVSAAAG